jgi:hypothetical protein
MTVIEAGNLIERLLNSQQACIRYQTRTKLLGEGGSSSSGEGERDSDRELQALAQEVRSSPLVEACYRKAQIMLLHPAILILSGMERIGYWLLWPISVIQPAMSACYPGVIRSWIGCCQTGVFRQRPLIAGLVRRCASQEGNALYYLIALGLDDERVDRLAHGLLEWQWPDGGWNCDRKLKASNSSFHETLLPMRGLAWYAKSEG